MESCSIVSFNNDSNFQSTIKADHNVSVHEFALHAMRDRCLLLQRRINSLETDNMKLKLQITKNSEFSSNYKPLQEDEKYQLDQKIAELNKQKSNLMHHVFMVTCENKNLWHKIANFKKNEKAQLTESSKHAPLLRTNTYIQSTPKYDLHQEKFSEASLEEISLKLINSYIQEKSQLVEQYEQMAQLQDVNEDIFNIDSIGFNYIEDPATDSLKEIMKQTEKLLELKKELLQQENDLKLITSRLEVILKEGYKCPNCINSTVKNISSEHKEIETSDSLANWATPVDSTTYNDNFNEASCDRPGSQSKLTIEEATDKICPMCGQRFLGDTDFSDFQTHVEGHFIGEMELDSNSDNKDISANNST